MFFCDDDECLVVVVVETLILAVMKMMKFEKGDDKKTKMLEDSGRSENVIKGQRRGAVEHV